MRTDVSPMPFRVMIAFERGKPSLIRVAQMNLSKIVTVSTSVQYFLLARDGWCLLVCDVSPLILQKFKTVYAPEKTLIPPFADNIVDGFIDI